MGGIQNRLMKYNKNDDIQSSNNICYTIVRDYRIAEDIDKSFIYSYIITSLGTR